MKHYNIIKDDCKRAFYREARAFLEPTPSTEMIGNMWSLWWREHRDLDTSEIKQKYFQEDEHSIYDCNLYMTDWWIKNENK